MYKVSVIYHQSVPLFTNTSKPITGTAVSGGNSISQDETDGLGHRGHRGGTLTPYLLLTSKQTTPSRLKYGVIIMPIIS